MPSYHKNCYGKLSQTQDEIMRTALNMLPHCPRCHESVDNIDVIQTVKFPDLVSLVQIKTHSGEEIARMMIEAIGKI